MHSGMIRRPSRDNGTTRVVAVGDPLQAIHAFTGADHEALSAIHSIDSSVTAISPMVDSILTRGHAWPKTRRLLYRIHGESVSLGLLRLRPLPSAKHASASRVNFKTYGFSSAKGRIAAETFMSDAQKRTEPSSPPEREHQDVGSRE